MASVDKCIECLVRIWIWSESFRENRLVHNSQLIVWITTLFSPLQIRTCFFILVAQQDNLHRWHSYVRSPWNSGCKSPVNLSCCRSKVKCTDRMWLSWLYLLANFLSQNLHFCLFCIFRSRWDFFPFRIFNKKNSDFTQLVVGRSIAALYCYERSHFGSTTYKYNFLIKIDHIFHSKG